MGALFENNVDVEGVDSYHACYGGTAALLACANWVESSAWDGRWAIAVCTDVSDAPKQYPFMNGAACVAISAWSRVEASTVASLTRPAPNSVAFSAAETAAGAARRRSVRLGSARARNGTTYADAAAARSRRLQRLIFRVLAGIECSFLCAP